MCIRDSAQHALPAVPGRASPGGPARRARRVEREARQAKREARSTAIAATRPPGVSQRGEARRAISAPGRLLSPPPCSARFEAREICPPQPPLRPTP
eukprot:3212297-Alexandrium_andersonii.AAC.1